MVDEWSALAPPCHGAPCLASYDRRMPRTRPEKGVGERAFGAVAVNRRTITPAALSSHAGPAREETPAPARSRARAPGRSRRIAASIAPHAAPAICAKPNKAAAMPALSANGDSAAALDSGLTMPTPNRKIAAETINGGSEFFATRAATSKRNGADHVKSQADQRRAIGTEPRRQSWRQHAGHEHQQDDAGKHQTERDRRRTPNAFEQHARRRRRKSQTSRPSVRPAVLAGARNRASRIRPR